MSDRAALVEFYRSQQEKYNYYVIALAVACIGFSVSLTMDKKLSLHLIPLGISMLCWMISVYSGLRFMSWVLSSAYANVGLIDVTEGRSELAGTHPEKIRIGIEVITRILENNSVKTTRLSNLRDWSFYVGVLSFIVWRFIEMR